MNFEDLVVIGLIFSNAVWIGYALMVRKKNSLLSARLFERAHWNWRQAKQWKN